MGVVVGARRTLWGVALLGWVVSSPAAAAWRSPLPRRLPTSPPAVALPWPRPDVLRLALTAYDCGRRMASFTGQLLTIIDYTLPSTARRLWVVDVASSRVLFNELVAHGAGSGENYAEAFSNQPGSRQSSLGLFRTEDVYQGGHGESLRLTGLEPGINDRAAERSIVMHPAPYVSDAIASAYGQLGRSWGCPALEPGVGRRVIERVKGRTALFAYYPDPQWLARSRFLRCGTDAAQERPGPSAAAAPAHARRRARS